MVCFLSGEPLFYLTISTILYWMGYGMDWIGLAAWSGLGRPANGWLALTWKGRVLL